MNKHGIGEPDDRTLRNLAPAALAYFSRQRVAYFAACGRAYFPREAARPSLPEGPGRPTKGSRNKLTLMREALAGHHADAVVQLALAGNRLATIALMEALVPPRASPAVAEISEPLDSARQGAAAMQTVVGLVSKGALSPAEGLRLTRQIDRSWRKSHKARLARLLADVTGSSTGARASRDVTVHATDAAPTSPPAPTR